MGPEFFQTLMGRQFYEGTMPRIARSLSRVADVLQGVQATDVQIETIEVNSLSKLKHAWAAFKQAHPKARIIKFEQVSAIPEPGAPLFHFVTIYYREDVVRD